MSVNGTHLTQMDVEERLIANRLGLRAGEHLVTSHCSVVVNENDFIIYPQHSDQKIARHVQTILEDVFADAANVWVEEPVGEPKPLSA